MTLRDVKAQRSRGRGGSAAARVPEEALDSFCRCGARRSRQLGESQAESEGTAALFASRSLPSGLCSHALSPVKPWVCACLRGAQEANFSVQSDGTVVIVDLGAARLDDEKQWHHVREEGSGVKSRCSEKQGRCRSFRILPALLL